MTLSGARRISRNPCGNGAALFVIAVSASALTADGSDRATPDRVSVPRNERRDVCEQSSELDMSRNCDGTSEMPE